MRSFVSRPVIYPMAASVKKHFVLLCFVLWFSASVSAVKAGSGALDAPGPVLWDPCITSRDVRRLKVQSHYMAVSVCTQVAKTLGVWIIFYPPNSQSSPTRFCQPCPTAYPSQAPVSCDSAEGMSTTISRSDLRPHSLDSEQQVQSCRIDSLVPQQCKAVCDLLVKLHPTGWCFDRHFAATTGCMDQKADWHPPTGACNLHSFDGAVHNPRDLWAAPRMTSENDNATLQWAAQDGSDCESTWRLDINSSNLRAVPRMARQHDNCASQRAMPHVRQFVPLSDPSEASWSERMLDLFPCRRFLLSKQCDSSGHWARPDRTHHWRFRFSAL